MSQTGIAKGFVFVVILLFLFAFLISVAPSDLISPDDPPDVQEIPDEWVAEQLLTYGEDLEYWGNSTLTVFDSEIINIGDVQVVCSWAGGNFYFDHRFEIALGFIYSSHGLTESPLSESDIINNIDPLSDPETSRQTMTCKRESKDPHAYTYFVSVSYNSTKYNSLLESMQGGEVRIFIGMGWEADIGSINAWSVISQLLLFQSPDVENAWINIIIGGCLWACIVYMAYVLIVLMIPFV